MAPDDHVGAFAVADFIFDDASYDVGVLLIGGLESASVVELNGQVWEHRQQVVHSDFVFSLDVDDR